MQPFTLTKSPIYGGEGIILKYSILKTGICLKLCDLLEEKIACIFNIYYLKINQKDKLLYIDMEKACLSVYLQKQKFKITIKESSDKISAASTHE